MPNPFSNRSGGLSAPAARIVPITPNNVADLPDGPCRALLASCCGEIDIIDVNGVERIALSVQEGFNPIGVRRVKADGGINLWALY